MVICTSSWLKFNHSFISLPLGFGLFSPYLEEKTAWELWLTSSPGKSWERVSELLSSLQRVSFCSHELMGRFIRLPLTLNFLFYPFFSILHHECSVSLKTYAFVVWNHYSLCWVTVKEKQFRKIERNKKKCVFPRWKFGGTWWAAFITQTSWKAAAAAAVRPSWSILRVFTQNSLPWWANSGASSNHY